MHEANSNAIKMPDRYPILFTCGPLQTSTTVKQAMVVDYGSRDQQFVDCIKEIRTKMLSIAHLTEKEWACVPMQGPGTMGLEASALTVTPRGGKYLLLNTGKYAERQGDMVKHLGYHCTVYDVPETEPIDLVKFEAFLKENGSQFNTIGYVHHETSTGMLNPVEKMFKICKTHAPQAAVLMDAISSFGGVDVHVDRTCDVMILSSNKCFHSVPGFSCCLIRRSLLDKCKGNSASFTLDLYRQCKGLDKTGQFPFTPPVHAMLAFRQAVREFEAEGGLPGRLQRYKRNSEILRSGLRSLGFETLLDEKKTPENFGMMLVSFKFPKQHPNWNFKKFYNGLRARGFVIYPGKASKSDAFRYACFGDLYPEDCVRIVGATAMVLKEMGMSDMLMKCGAMGCKL
jgi:2-aminoethylphosphonate-pyruvate transaminase